MTEQRIEQIARTMLDAVDVAVFCDERLALRQFVSAAIDRFDSLNFPRAGDAFINLARAADERQQLVFPIDLSKGIRLVRQRFDVGIVRMVQEEASSVDV